MDIHREERSVLVLCSTLTLVLSFLPLSLSAAPVPHVINPDPATTPIETRTNQLTYLVASNAWLAVVNESAQTLVVAHLPGANPHLSIFPLDAAGLPSSNAVTTITLPKPDTLAAYTNFPLSVQMHPTLPLMYVWQDMGALGQPPLTDPKTNPVYLGLDRLLIYRFTSNGVEQVTATCRGPEYCYGNWPYGPNGAIGLDAANKRLFLPSLCSVDTGSNDRIGYLRLGDDGLPLMENAKPILTTMHVTPASHGPIGFGWHPVGTDRVVVSGGHGILTWDLVNRRAALVQLNDQGMGWRVRFYGHPQLPFAYAVSHYRMKAYALADGYPTMVPQELSRTVCSAVILPKSNQLVAGSSDVLWFVQLSDEGWFTDKLTKVPVPNYAGWALCYSPKFDKIYVIQEKAG